MKLVFVLILVISSNHLFGQKLRTVYTWEQVQNASSDTIYAISFKKLKLDSVPLGLSEFKNVEFLDFTKNNITEIPFFFRDFKQLTHLKLEKNKLVNFPLALCGMSSIDTLEIGSNNIASIPSCISNMEKLIYLDAYDNPLGDLPEGLLQLKELKKIDLSGIRFSERFQTYWLESLPLVEFVFDSPCACMD